MLLLIFSSDENSMDNNSFNVVLSREKILPVKLFCPFHSAPANKPVSTWTGLWSGQNGEEGEREREKLVLDGRG